MVWRTWQRILFSRNKQVSRKVAKMHWCCGRLYCKMTLCWKVCGSFLYASCKTFWTPLVPFCADYVSYVLVDVIVSPVNYVSLMLSTCLPHACMFLHSTCLSFFTALHCINVVFPMSICPSPSVQATCFMSVVCQSGSQLGGIYSPPGILPVLIRQACVRVSTSIVVVITCSYSSYV